MVWSSLNQARRFQLPNNHSTLHDSALKAATNYRRSVHQLIEILQQVEHAKTFYHYNCKSVFEYCVQVLNLSESVAYGLIRVGRKSLEVPELKEKIKTGEVPLSKAARICSVLKSNPTNGALDDYKLNGDHLNGSKKRDSLSSQNISSNQAGALQNSIAQKNSITQQNSLELENSSEQSCSDVSTSNLKWIEKAMTLSSRELEKEVAKANPKDFSLKERRKTLDDQWESLSLKLHTDQMKKIKKAKALLESKQKKPLSITECFLIMSDMVEEKFDPLKRAERSQKRQLKKKIKSTKKFCEAEEQQKPQKFLSKGSYESQAAKGNQRLKGSRDSQVFKKDPDQKSNVKQIEIRNLSEPDQSHPSNRPSSKRPYLSALLRHKVFLKHRGECNRCQSTTYLEIHHQIPRYRGGGDELENLELLCSPCHKRHHHLNGDPNYRSKLQKIGKRRIHNPFENSMKNDCAWVEL